MGVRNSRGTRIVESVGRDRWGDWEIRLVSNRPLDRVPLTVDGVEVGTLSLAFRDPDVDGDTPPQGDGRELFTLRPRVPNTTMRERIRGAVGLMKAEMNLSPADPGTVDRRQATCESCEHFDFGRCAVAACKCYLWAKVRIAGEKCPMEKW